LFVCSSWVCCGIAWLVRWTSHCHVMALDNLFTYMCLSPSSIICNRSILCSSDGSRLCVASQSRRYLLYGDVVYETKIRIPHLRTAGIWHAM